MDASLALVLLLAVLQSPGERRPGRFHEAYWDSVDEQGRLVGGTFQVFVPDDYRTAGRIPSPCTTLTASVLPPNPANRLDLVVVGDG